MIGTSFAAHQIQNQWGENELHCQFHLPARYDNAVWTRHKGIMQHGKQIWKIDSLGVGKPDYHKTFGRGRNGGGDKGVRSIDSWHALEIDVTARKLRAYVIYVIRHAAQDCVDYRLLRVATHHFVA